MDIGENITVRCPHCEWDVSQVAHLTGDTVTCPGCHREFRFFSFLPSHASRTRAARLGYRFVGLDKTEIPQAAPNMVPEQVALENKILPVVIDGDILTVARNETGVRESQCQEVVGSPI